MEKRIEFEQKKMEKAEKKRRFDKNIVLKGNENVFRYRRKAETWMME